MNLHDWIRFIRLKYHISIFMVILGFLFAGEYSLRNIIRLFFIILSFLVLYSGIYVLNDIADYNNDLLNKDKLAISPLLKGNISKKNATRLGGAFLILGEVFLILNGFTYGLFGTIFILINAIYTYWLKGVPYLEILINAMTHPVRFWLGYAVIAFPFTNQWFLILTVIMYLGCISIGVTRRLTDLFNKLTSEYRESLGYYSIKGLMRIKLSLLIVVAFLYILSGLPVWIIALGLSLQTLDFVLVNNSNGYKTFYKKIGS